MTGKKVRVTYKCLHPSCVVYCREGILTMDEEIFKDLLAANDQKNVFKSPRGACRLGYSQGFRADNVDTHGVAEASEGREKRMPSLTSENPLEVLIAEHMKVSATLDEIEECLRKRDLDGLWKATADLENEIVLHSLQKEELLLFPRIHNLIPLAEGLITIVQEDHREFTTLLMSFRGALVDGDILDGLATSIIVNLRNHIKKENDEFFPLLEDHLDLKTRQVIIKEMREMDAAFTPKVPGKRTDAKELSTAKSRYHFDDMASAARDARLADAESGGGCCHETHND